jgi:hypothetical protein
LIASVFEHLPHLKFHIHFKITSFFFPPFSGSFSSTEWQLGEDYMLIPFHLLVQPFHCR